MTYTYNPSVVSKMLTAASATLKLKSYRIVSRNNVTMSAAKKTLAVSDGDNTVVLPMGDITITGPTCAVPISTFTALGADTIDATDFETSGKVALTKGRTRVTVDAGAPEDNIVAPVTAHTTGVYMTRADSETLASVMSDQPERYYICGVAVDVHEQMFVATNGAAMVVTPFTEPVAVPALSAEDVANHVVYEPQIVDRAAVLLANRFMSLTKTDGYTIYITPQTGSVDTTVYATLAGEGWEIITRLVVGTYPTWRRVIPDMKSYKVSQTYTVTSLLDALTVHKKLSAVANPTLLVKGDSVSSFDSSKRIEHTVRCIQASGDPDDVYMAYDVLRPMLDAYKRYDTLDVTLHTKGGGDTSSPMRANIGSTTFIVMPTRA